MDENGVKPEFQSAEQKPEKQAGLSNFILYGLLAISAIGLVVVYMMKLSAPAGRRQAAESEVVFTSKPAVVEQEQKLGKLDQAVTSFKIKIEGTPQFEEKARSALGLIWVRAPEAFEMIKANVYTIRQDNKSDFQVESGIPTVTLHDRDVINASPTWTAGVIAHQAGHAFRYYEKKRAEKALHIPPQPGQQGASSAAANPLAFDFTNLSSLNKTERDIDAFQIEVMKKVGAPASEIEKIRNRAENDFSATHYGR